MVQAVLFDFDGTLVNSDSAHLLAFNEALTDFNLSMSPEEYERFAGLSNQMMLDGIFPELDKNSSSHIAVAKEHYYLRFLDTVSLNDGAFNCLEALDSAGMRISIVTNAHRNSTLQILNKLSVFSFIEEVVCSDDVSNSKPHPEPYVTALRKLNLLPEQAFAVEDSDTGRISAEAAGLKIVMYGSQGNEMGEGGTQIERILHMNELTRLLLSDNGKFVR